MNCHDSECIKTEGYGGEQTAVGRREGGQEDVGKLCRVGKKKCDTERGKDLGLILGLATYRVRGPWDNLGILSELVSSSAKWR